MCKLELVEHNMVDVNMSHNKTIKKYIRTGKCLRCGACGCEKLKCLHFEWQDGLATCTIYNDRDHEICEECTEYMSKKYGKKVVISHKQCITFPDNPKLNVIKNGKCGYKFEEIS